jgi:hypothetical protein
VCVCVPTYIHAVKCVCNIPVADTVTQTQEDAHTHTHRERERERERETDRERERERERERDTEISVTDKVANLQQHPQDAADAGQQWKGEPVENHQGHHACHLGFRV